MAGGRVVVGGASWGYVTRLHYITPSWYITFRKNLLGTPLMCHLEEVPPAVWISVRKLLTVVHQLVPLAVRPFYLLFILKSIL